MRCCKICAKTAEWRPEDPSHFCLQGTQTRSQRWLQLHLQYHNWCMVMTMRLSSSRHRSHQIHRDRKKRVNFAAMSMLIIFFDTQGIVHKEFAPTGQTVNWNFTVRFWSGKVRAFGANIQTSGRTQLVSPPWCACSHITHSTIPDFQKHYSDSQPTPHSPDIAPCKFFLFPKMKLQLKVHHFDMTEEIHAESQEVINTHLRTSRDAWNHEKYAGIAVHTPKGTTMKETVETRSYGKKLFCGQIPWLLYTRPRGLLWRSRWKLGVTVRNFFYGQIPQSFG
jgi:hypothetical protein